MNDSLPNWKDIKKVKINQKGARMLKIAKV